MVNAIQLSIMIDAVNKGAAAYKQVEGGMKGIKKAISDVTAHVKMMAAYAAFDFLKTGIKNFIALEKAAAESATIIGGSEDTIREFGDAYREMAQDLPVKSIDLAAAHYQILSLGITETVDSFNTLGIAAKAAVAGLTSVETAGEAGAMMMNAFGMDASNLNDIFDLQFHIIDKGKIKYNELANITGTISSAAVGAGQAIEEMAGHVAFFTARGNDASKAATMIRGMYNAMTDPEVLRKLVDMGVQVTDLTDEQIRQSRTLQEVRDRMNDVKTAMGDVAATIESKRGTIEGLQISIARSNQELAQQEQVLQQLAGEYRRTESVVEGFQDQMNAFNLESRKNNLEIMQIRRAAEKEGRELTESEQKQIDELQSANSDLRISTEQLAIKQAEARIKADEQRDAMQGQAAKVATLEETLQAQMATLDGVNESLETATTDYQALGTELESANADWAEQISLMGEIRPMSELIKDLTKSMSGYTDAEKKVKLAEIFTNVRARSGIIMMTENLDDYTDTMDSFNDSSEYAGKTQEKFGLINKTTWAETEIAKNRVEELQMSVAEDLMPAIVDLSEKLGTMAKWLSDNTWLIYGVIAAMVLLKGITTALIIIKSLWAIVQWTVNVAMYACPIFWLIGLIALLIAAIVLLVVYWDEVVEALKVVWDWMKKIGSAIAGVGKAIGKFFVDIGVAIGRFVAEIGKMVGQFFAKIGLAVGRFFGSIGVAIGRFVGNMAVSGYRAIVEFGRGIGRGISSAMKAIGRFLASIGRRFTNFIKDMAKSGWDMVKEFVKGIGRGVAKFGKKVAGYAKKLVGKGWIWDQRENDLMGIGWGLDLVKFVAMGIDMGVGRNRDKLSMPVEMISPKLTGGLSPVAATSAPSVRSSNDQYRITVNVQGSELEKQNYLDIIKKQTRRQTRRAGDSKRWYDE